MKNPIVLLAADHNGVEQKQLIKELLNSSGYSCVDLGPFTDRNSVDYVDYAMQLGEMIKRGDAYKGVLICGTGVGMSIAANKVENIRAALVHNIYTAPKSREHNDANILCLGSWINSPEKNMEIVKLWFSEKFGEYRHVKRVEKLINHNEEQIIFTNGIFDIFHRGHIELLKFCKSIGGRIVVGINSDKSTKKIKGDNRPINSEKDRKAVLEANQSVDEVVIFDELTPKNIINEINPNIVVKGGEWTADQIREKDKIPSHIGIKVFPIVDKDNYSSSKIIDRINANK
jgi:rfaE bifunctional protein nucleotidyltransferase chain/domain